MQEVTASTIRLPAAQESLGEILRRGAQQLLAQAIEAEVAAWIDEHQHVKDEHGRRQVVRNGYLPERKLVTPVGEVAMQQPRVYDRRPAGEREKFSSKLLPPYLRKTKSIEELIPYLYLKGISTGDFQEALSAILGADGRYERRPNRNRVCKRRRQVLRIDASKRLLPHSENGSCLSFC